MFRRRRSNEIRLSLERGSGSSLRSRSSARSCTRIAMTVRSGRHRSRDAPDVFGPVGWCGLLTASAAFTVLVSPIGALLCAGLLVQVARVSAVGHGRPRPTNVVLAAVLIAVGTLSYMAEGVQPAGYALFVLGGIAVLIDRAAYADGKQLTKDPRSS